MKILALTPALYDTSPGQRFRVEQWARYLQPAGFEFTFIPFEDTELHKILYQPGDYVRKASLMLRAFARRLGLVRAVPRFDVVFLHREAALIGPALIEHLIARKRVPVVYDFDDAIWVPYISPANRFLSYFKCFGKTAAICRVSTHIIVGNGYLADYARHHNQHVAVVPTTIDTQAYTKRSRGTDATGGPVTIGWTGSYSTVQHLDTLRPCLTKLGAHAAFRLNVIGTASYELDGVSTVARVWRAKTEIADLQRFDIGIMPLPDDDWSQGKCGLKLLQCMGLGIPVVGSPVGVNAEIIRDGVNGFLATTEREWIEKLTLLIRDPTLRHQMGMAGRQTVEEGYAASVWAPRVGEILASVAGRT